MSADLTYLGRGCIRPNNIKIKETLCSYQLNVNGGAEFKWASGGPQNDWDGHT